MRIAYFAHVNEGRASGVVAKITSQLEQWRHVGHTARLFLATKDTDLAWTDALGDVTVERYSGYPSRLVAMTRLVRSVRGFGPDVVYLRWDLFYPPMLALPSKRPLVAEINTDDLAEYALDRGIRARYNRLTRGLILGRADALVFVTSELSQRPAFRGASARRVVITNGIDLVDYPELPAPTDGPPRLVFVGGAIAPWHGVDRILELADRRPGWQFDIVGRDGPPQGGGNVHWHGTLERDALLPVLAAADVGIGSLALHRYGLTEASPLKAREYLAVGLPMIYAYTDADADRLGDYVLRIANSPTNVADELDRIDSFVNRVRGLRIPRSLVRHIDTSAKEAERLALFESLAHG